MKINDPKGSLKDLNMYVCLYTVLPPTPDLADIRLNTLRTVVKNYFKTGYCITYPTFLKAVPKSLMPINHVSL